MISCKKKHVIIRQLQMHIYVKNEQRQVKQTQITRK